jgi:hypothetical protein
MIFNIGELHWTIQTHSNFHYGRMTIAYTLHDDNHVLLSVFWLYLVKYKYLSERKKKYVEQKS